MAINERQKGNGNAQNAYSEGDDGNKGGEKRLARWAPPNEASRALALKPTLKDEINSRKAWYRCQLGRALWALGRVHEAIEHFEKACELMPYEPYYRLELAEAYLALGRYEEAVEQLEQTILWAPWDDYYHVRLAAAYLVAGRLDDAVATMEKTVKLSPLNASYHFLLGLLYLMQGEKERAAFHLRFRCQLDQYDQSFLRQFQKLCGNALHLPKLH